MKWLEHPSFAAAKRLARSVVRDRLRLLRVLTAVVAKAENKRELLHGVKEDFRSLVELVNAWVRREYKEVPLKSILLIVAAFLYFLSPLDAIPDFLPGGYLDDIGVFMFVLTRVRKDLQAFRDWKKEKKNTIEVGSSSKSEA